MKPSQVSNFIDVFWIDGHVNPQALSFLEHQFEATD
jgi:hypothetical protein